MCLQNIVLEGERQQPECQAVGTSQSRVVPEVTTVVTEYSAIRRQGGCHWLEAVAPVVGGSCGGSECSTIHSRHGTTWNDHKECIKTAVGIGYECDVIGHVRTEHLHGQLHPLAGMQDNQATWHFRHSLH